MQPGFCASQSVNKLHGLCAHPSAYLNVLDGLRDGDALQRRLPPQLLHLQELLLQSRRLKVGKEGRERLAARSEITPSSLSVPYRVHDGGVGEDAI